MYGRARAGLYGELTAVAFLSSSSFPFLSTSRPRLPLAASPGRSPRGRVCHAADALAARAIFDIRLSPRSLNYFSARVLFIRPDADASAAAFGLIRLFIDFNYGGGIFLSSFRVRALSLPELDLNGITTKLLSFNLIKILRKQRDSTFTR